jgi:anthranilate phosphoribosyltransferase
MRHAGPVRREIGIRTVFNILGPLTNPAGAQTQLLGVAFPELGETMAEVLGILGSHRAMIVHGHGGLDELSLSGDSAVWEVRQGSLSRWTVRVEDTGLPVTPISAIQSGTKEENAATMRRLFQGETGPVRDIVLLNSAVWEVRQGSLSRWTVRVEDTGLPVTPISAIQSGTKEENAATMRRLFQGETGPVRDIVLLNSAGVLMAGDLAGTIREGIDMASGLIDSGAALSSLDRLVEVSQAQSAP